ncbi:MAG TPA: molybdenum cofactor guanylyltransferase [Armatimonadota bacterium]|nr:molybdenum cofactor guanylyltransferase [Armatimonadota bacterium]
MSTEPRTRSTASRIAAAILAGGRASRLGGIVKGLIQLPDGRTIIERLIEEVRGAGIFDIIICANDPAPYQDLGLPIIADSEPGLGPLGGIAAALSHFAPTAEAVLLLAGDMPAITAGELRLLLAAFGQTDAPAVFAEAPDGPHPLVAVARTGLRDEVERARHSDNRGANALWRRVGAEPVSFPQAYPFANINTPGDLDRWQRANPSP